MQTKIFLIIVVILLIVYKRRQNVECFTNKKSNDWLQEIFDYRQIITIPDRKKHVLKFCKSFDLKPTIFNAILKDEISYKNLYGLKIGEIACAMSQEAVLKKFVKTGKSSLLMFEDDNIPFTFKFYKKSGLSLDNIKNYVKNAYNMLPANWDVLYLGRCWDNCNRNIKINKYLYKTHRTLCHHAIAFSRQGAIRVLEAISHPLQRPIDHIVARLTTQGEIDAYATIIPVFYQNRDKMESTVGNFDNLPVCA